MYYGQTVDLGLRQTGVAFELDHLLALLLPLSLLGFCIMKLLICKMGMKGLEAMNVLQSAHCQGLGASVMAGGSYQHHTLLSSTKLE